MKKLLIFVLLCICIPVCSYADETKTIRVGLYYDSTAKQSVTVESEAETKEYFAADIGEKIDISGGETVKVDGKSYRGSITLEKNSDGLINVINTLSVEDYLCAVLPREMSPSFEAEALKAQAVAARTYVLKHLGKHSSSGFDVCDTIHCQVYGGYSSESEKTTAAVKATAGQVALYNGALIDAVYSASSGGYTESAVNVWGSDFAYLQAVEDPYEEDAVYGHSWTREMTPVKATEIMKARGYDIGDVTSIIVEETSPAGSVTKLTVKGTNGEKTFTKESCRNIFSEYTLSQAYTVTPPSGGAVYCTGGTVDKPGIYLLSYNGVTKYDNSAFFITDGKETKNAEISESGSYVFNGRGFGHLVGMSQNGANGMAKNGFTYDEILKHYYKGIEIK